MTASPERRYRRMLTAYPKPYRRRHEAEILTTLLEMAESGHHRPAAAVRQRFRLPAARPLPAIAAVLAAIAMGALGAAGGTWLGWQTATPLPSGGETRALTAELAGGSPTDVAVYPWQTAMKGPAVTTRVTIPSTYSPERVRNALTSAGWRTTTQLSDWVGHRGGRPWSVWRRTSPVTGPRESLRAGPLTERATVVAGSATATKAPGWCGPTGCCGRRRRWRVGYSRPGSRGGTPRPPSGCGRWRRWSHGSYWWRSPAR